MDVSKYTGFEGKKIWTGPFRKADPEWENEFTEWIYKYIPDPSLIKIENILQKEDQYGFKIDLLLNNSFKSTLWLHCQIENPFKEKFSPYLIQFNIPLPLKQYHPIFLKQDDKLAYIPKYHYIILKEDGLAKEDDDPLLNSINKVEIKWNYYMKKSTQIKTSFSQQIGISRKYWSIEIRNPLRMIYSEEYMSMILEQESFLVFNMKKKKQRISKSSTSFYGVYDLTINRYNDILTYLEKKV